MTKPEKSAPIQTMKDLLKAKPDGTVYTMELHASLVIEHMMITRVPGGWLYSNKYAPEAQTFVEYREPWRFPF